MLKFGKSTAQLLDMAYQGADVSRRRRANFDAIAPAPGEAILDLGCGTGLLTAELARAVGPNGQVTGLDTSPDMLAAARSRCSAFEHVDLVEGSAFDMPIPKQHFDKAVSVQVFEYFADPAPALSELNRVLRPGGRLVIGDTHWDSLTWHSDHPERMRRICEIWDTHLADRCVPAALPAALRDCGFQPDHVRPVTFCDTTLRPDGLALMMIRLMQDFAIQSGEISDAEATAWADEQNALADAGRFFMSITHFVWVAHKSRSLPLTN